MAALQFRRSNICILHMAGAAASVDIWHTVEPLGHAAVSLGRSFTAGAQESVHVVAVLANGIFNARDVQPADDHPEELQRDRAREGRKEERGRERESEQRDRE